MLFGFIFPVGSVYFFYCTIHITNTFIFRHWLSGCFCRFVFWHFAQFTRDSSRNHRVLSKKLNAHKISYMLAFTWLTVKHFFHDYSVFELDQQKRERAGTRLSAKCIKLWSELMRPGLSTLSRARKYCSVEWSHYVSQSWSLSLDLYCCI